MADDKATSEGARLINNWLNAKQSLDAAKSRVNSCECDVMNTERALAKWLLPDDARAGEKIAVWHGDSLIQAEVRSGSDPVVTVRTRGRSVNRAA